MTIYFLSRFFVSLHGEKYHSIIHLRCDSTKLYLLLSFCFNSRVRLDLRVMQVQWAPRESRYWCLLNEYINHPIFCREFRQTAVCLYQCPWLWRSLPYLGIEIFNMSCCCMTSTQPMKCTTCIKSVSSSYIKAVGFTKLHQVWESQTWCKLIFADLLQESR